MESDDYNIWAIIDSEGGWLVTMVVWNGDTTIWSTLPGTYAVRRNEIDFSQLPSNPQFLLENSSINNL